LDENNQPAQDHVYACSKESRGQKKRESLHDVDTEGILVVMSKSTADIANKFKETSNDQGDKVVGTISERLENVDACRNEEAHDEDYGCRERRMISVENEGVGIIDIRMIRS